MCKFCKNNGYKKYLIPLRSTYADDNTCEYVSPENYEERNIQENGICYRGVMSCEDCDGCADGNYTFKLNKHEDNSIGLEFYHKIRGLKISPFSELLSINYCPWCGNKLVDDNKMIEFENCVIGGIREEQE